MAPWTYRRADNPDRAAIRTVLELAFAPSMTEAQLVEWILDDAGLEGDIHHWVALDGDRVIAYVLYSVALRGEKKIGYHLAPVAVHPDYQGRGVGSALIRFSLEQPALESVPAFVLGDPKYYERFGFVSVRSAKCPYDPENAYFRAREWSDADEDEFTVAYVGAFERAFKI